MTERESLNCEIDENAWQKLRRTMGCLSDRPFQIMFIKGNANDSHYQLQSEMTQSDNSTQLDLTTSSALKTAIDEVEESCRNLSGSRKMLKSPGKTSLRDQPRYLQNCNIAELNKIFDSDTRKTEEIIANLYARMERIKELNRELRDLLAYFNDDTDSSRTLTSC